VRQEVQWYLTERLVESRTRPVPPGQTTIEHRLLALAAFGATLEALRYVDELSADDVSDWSRRMFRALGVQIDESQGAGSHAVYVGDEPPPEPGCGPSMPQFPKRIDPRNLGACRAHGAELTLDEVEYDDNATAVRWTISGPFDVDAAFPEPFAQLQADVTGLDDWAVDLFRDKTRDNLRMWRVPAISLGDDVGTEYAASPKSIRSQPGRITGLTLFAPGPASHARRLSFGWHGSTIEVHMPGMGCP
jgi:hypothetical protein